MVLFPDSQFYSLGPRAHAYATTTPLGSFVLSLETERPTDFVFFSNIALFVWSPLQFEVNLGIGFVFSLKERSFLTFDRY